MVNCLREGLVYSEKRARDLLFDAFEMLARESAPPLILSRLTREAAARARLAAARAGFEFSNWETAAKAVAKAMLNAGVLLSAAGAPIPVSVAAQGTEVAAIHPAARDRAEAYLLERIIRELGDVSARDHTALAHALFRQFDPGVAIEDLEDRVVVLLAMLHDRVTLGPDGTYQALELSS
jgi:hypothetical protein